MWGDARALEEIRDVVDDSCGRALGGSQVDVARAAVAQLAGQEGGVEALGGCEHDVVPAKALGDALLARDAVQQRRDARVGANERGCLVERGIQAGGLDGKDEKLGRARLACADAGELAGASVDLEPVVGVALEARVVHDVLHGICAERLGRDAAVE